jgi:hypothetical protein
MNGFHIAHNILITKLNKRTNDNPYSEEPQNKN